MVLLRTLALLVVVFAGCSRDTNVTVAPKDAGAPAPTAQSTLDRMDPRTPVPLLPMMANHQKQNMRAHLEAVQQIIAALAADDFAGIEVAVKGLGFSEQMGQMCNHMGAGAPGFTEQALGFHHQADRIGDAARAKDKARVLVELNATLLTCTACHEKWKQQVVDEATWEKATASAPPMPH